jgi:hypothetical protein
MNTQKKLPVIVIVIGLIILILSLLLDLLGFGRSPGIGPNQLLGIIVGAVIVLTGLFLLLKKK